MSSPYNCKVFECQYFLQPATTNNIEVLLDQIQHFSHNDTEVECSSIAPGQTGIAGEVDATSDLPAVIVSLQAPTTDILLAAASGLTKCLGDTFDKTQSLIIGTHRLEILPGSGSIRIHYGLHSLPNMSRTAFQDYWLNTHADIGRQLIPPYSYFQSHADDELTARLVEICGLKAATFDGIVTVHFPNMEACQAQLSRTDVGEIAIEDERRFIDHNHVEFGVYEVI